ncbi:MAG: hypothetical protein AVO39_10925 [delta proteobacterium MLS_D]|nr:MAG: hypothetical protein AVO39_10925 [delta proteobacterium MLS_D]
MGWKDEARRTIIGEKVMLETFPGYWIRPRKYSIETMDEIRAIERKQQGEFNRKALARIAKKMSESGNIEDPGTIAPAMIMGELTDEEFEAIYEVSENRKAGPGAQLIIAKIHGGVGEHNFDGAKIETLAKDMVDYPDIAREMITIIEEYNRPLAGNPSGISEPLPDGSTKGESSRQTEKTSQTDETPGS